MPTPRTTPEEGLFLRVLPDGVSGLLSRDAFSWLVDRSPTRRFAWDVAGEPTDPSAGVALRPAADGSQRVTGWRRLRVQRVAVQLPPGRYVLQDEDGRLVVVRSQ